MPTETPVTNFSQFMQAKAYLVPHAADKLNEFKTAAFLLAKLGDTPSVIGQVETVLRTLSANVDSVLRLAKDETRNDVMKHAVAKELAERTSAIVRITRDNIARDAQRMQDDAMAEIHSVLGSKDHAREREIRDWMRSTLASGDETAIANVTSLAKRDAEVARSIYSAGFFLTGMSEQLHATVRANSVKQFVPGAADMLSESHTIQSKLSNWDQLPGEIHAAFYNPHLADRASTRVDV